MANDKENRPADNIQAPNVCTFSLPMMMSALHQKAISMVGKEFKISNSAIEGEGKNAKLISAGEHIICVTSSKQGEEIYRGDATKALVDYVTWFAGPDVAKEVNEKTVIDIVSKDDESQQGNDGKEDDDKKYSDGEDLDDDVSNDEEDNDESTSKDDVEEDEVTKESMSRKIQFSLITDGNIMSFKNFLRESIIDEANDESGQNENKTENSEEDDAAEGKSDESSQGYYIAYKLKVNGLKESKLKDSMVDLAKGLFDSLTITGSGLFGGGASFTGKDIRKKLNELMNIDTVKLANDVKTFLTKRYPQTEVDAYERDGSTLYKELNKKYASQLDKDQKATIQSAPYSVCIKVKEKDIAKPFLNTRKIAEAIRKCMSFFKLGSKLKVDADSIIVINDYVDKRSQDEADANKRPTYQHLKKEILKVMSDESGDMRDSIGYIKGFDLFTDIKEIFQRLRRNKKAMEQDENIKAVKLFDEFEKKKRKEFDNTEHKFKYSDFKDFLDAYEKLDDLLKKESIDALNRYGIAKMLFEQLFGRQDSFSQFINEKVPFNKLGKLTSKISQLHQDGKLKYPKASILDKDGKSTGQTKEIGDKEILNGLQYGVLEFDEKTDQLKVTDKKGLRIEADGTLLTPNEEKRKYSDLMSDEDNKSDDEHDEETSNEEPESEDIESSSDEDGHEDSPDDSPEENNSTSSSDGDSDANKEATGSEASSGEGSSNGENAEKKENNEGTVLYIYPVKNSNKLDDGMED